MSKTNCIQLLAAVTFALLTADFTIAQTVQLNKDIRVTVVWSPSVENNVGIQNRVRETIIKRLNGLKIVSIPWYWTFSSEPSLSELEVTLEPRSKPNTGNITFKFLFEGITEGSITTLCNLPSKEAKDAGWISFVDAAVQKNVADNTNALRKLLMSLPFTATVTGLPQELPASAPATMATLKLRAGPNPRSDLFLIDTQSSAGMVAFLSSASGLNQPLGADFQNSIVVVDKYRWGTDYISLEKPMIKGQKLSAFKPLKVFWRGSGLAATATSTGLLGASQAP